MSSEISTIIDGPESAPVIVFLHGWPDDATLFDHQVAELKSKFRCIRFTLPNYNGKVESSWGYPFDVIVEKLYAAIKKHTKSSVTLFVHDWGCMYGYMLQKAHPEVVNRMIICDIGGHVTPKPLEMLFIAVYQLYLVTAFLIGGFVGNWMTWGFAKVAKAPNVSSRLISAMNYPYFHYWKSMLTGQKRQTFRPYEQCPVLYLYGTQKPFMFHSEKWIASLKQTAKCKIASFVSDHWFLTRSKTRAAVNSTVSEWLNETQ